MLTKEKLEKVKLGASIAGGVRDGRRWIAIRDVTFGKNVGIYFLEPLTREQVQEFIHCDEEVLEHCSNLV